MKLDVVIYSKTTAIGLFWFGNWYDEPLIMFIGVILRSWTFQIGLESHGKRYPDISQSYAREGISRKRLCRIRQIQ